MPLNRKPKQHSLRARYISLALLLGFIIIIGASIGYRVTLIDSNEADEMLDQISQQSEHLERIKELVHSAYHLRDLFLIEPQKTAQRLDAEDNLSEVIFHIEQIEAIDSAVLPELNEPLTQLKDKIKRLKAETTRLFNTRVNPIQQYPSIQIINTVSHPTNEQIITALDEAIIEAKAEVLESGPEVYHDFVELRNIWNKLRLYFRIYVANRTGGFDNAMVREQSDAVENLYAIFNDKSTKLKWLNIQDELGFDGSIAVEIIEKYTPEWFRGYKSIKELEDSGVWRRDTLIMQQKVLPLAEEVGHSIHLIADLIKHQHEHIAESYDRIRTTQNLLIAAIIIIIIIYIITMLISLDKMVFRPISAVAHALKAEAFGENRENLVHTRSRETQDLVDAFHEMNLQVRNRQMALEYQAMHDALTGLPNRVMLLERMEYQLMMTKREEHPLSLFILDLNRFKEVNDTLGHHIGDHLLVDVGCRFRDCLREIDTIARLGGDEFAVLLPNTTYKQAETVADKLVKSVNKPFIIEENRLHIGVSIGIACYPRDGEDHNTLMQHADVAMYNAKLNHLGYTHYNIDEDENSLGRLSLVQDLRDAIQNGELELYFQPKMDIYEFAPVGAEALLRWQHPELGFIPPDQVVDIAEGTGLIDKLTSWVMNQAIAQCASCHQEGFELNMSINLSVKNLLNNDLSNEIKGLLEKHQISSRHLTFEVTEGSMMENPENAIKVLNELSNIGVRISVDDFGTGFSSLAYLKQLPVNELKIDKSFVIEMEKNDSDAVIVHSTIELGHNLGLSIVAEGVEDQQTCNILKHYGCDLAQGYFITRPLPADEFMQWLKAHTE